MLSLNMVAVNSRCSMAYLFNAPNTFNWELGAYTEYLFEIWQADI